MLCDITENFHGPSLNTELLQCQPFLQYLMIILVCIETVLVTLQLFIFRLSCTFEHFENAKSFKMLTTFQPLTVEILIH